MKFLCLFVLLLVAHLPKIVQSVGTCGNGIVEGSEECDDGNLINEDGCDSLCIIDPYYRCDASVPNICKIDSKVSFVMLGNHRITSSNTVIIKLGFQVNLSVFSKINL